MNRTHVKVGYTRSTLNYYRHANFLNLTEADIQITDGLGNIIEVNVTQADKGYRITLNGKEIASSGSGGKE